jgi:PHD/YefM family antitoxin component YafN of YafNO toxin-antitoxin module
MATTTFSYSTFLRSPSQVAPALDTMDVILERRDDENLVLMRAGRFEASQTGTRLLARSLAIIARRYPELAEEALRDELPWLRWLPENEQADCLRELLADLLAGADTGHLLPFARDYWGWRSTAEVRSDPALAESLKGPFAGDGGVVPRPLPPENA